MESFCLLPFLSIRFYSPFLFVSRLTNYLVHLGSLPTGAHKKDGLSVGCNLSHHQILEPDNRGLDMNKSYVPWMSKGTQARKIHKSSKRASNQDMYHGNQYNCAMEIKAHNRFLFGIGVDLFKSISRMEGLLRFPSYYTTFVIYDQILCFGWFPSNNCYPSNGDAEHFVLNNVDYLEI